MGEGQGEGDAFLGTTPFDFASFGRSFALLPSTSLRYASFDFTPLRFLRLHSVTLPSTSLRYASFDFTPLRFLRLHSVTLPSTSLRYASFDFTPLRFLRLHSVTLRMNGLSPPVHPSPPFVLSVASAKSKGAQDRQGRLRSSPTRRDMPYGAFLPRPLVGEGRGEGGCRSYRLRRVMKRYQKAGRKSG